MKKREPVVRIAALDWVYRQPLPSSRKAVLIYLVRRADKAGRCWPSQRTVASEIGLGLKTISRAIQVLKLCGLVSIARKAKRPKGRTGVMNIYQINYDVTVTPEGAKRAEQIAKALDQRVTVTHRSDTTKESPFPDQRVMVTTEERQEEELTFFKGVSIGAGGAVAVAAKILGRS